MSRIHRNSFDRSHGASGLIGAGNSGRNSIGNLAVRSALVIIIIGEITAQSGNGVLNGLDSAVDRTITGNSGVISTDVFQNVGDLTLKLDYVLSNVTRSGGLRQLHQIATNGGNHISLGGRGGLVYDSTNLTNVSYGVALGISLELFKIVPNLSRINRNGITSLNRQR